MMVLLKRIKIKILQWLYPQRSGCECCGTPWIDWNNHITWYWEEEFHSWGCSPLCEECWQNLTPETRQPFYKIMFNRWVSSGLSDYNGMPWYSIWVTIEKAVLEGK